MSSRSKLFSLFLLLFILAVLQAIYFYPKLPSRVATHFNRQGEADGFSSKKTAVTVNLALFAILSGFFYGLGSLVGKLPDSLINIPNKKYWLNQQNREKTIGKIAGFGIKIGIATQVYLLYLFQLTYRVNITDQKLDKEYFWYGLLFYMIYVIYQTWQLYHFFKQKVQIYMMNEGDR